MSEQTELQFPERFNGPPTSAHGGYACGRFATLAAAYQGPVVTVTLTDPVPLEEPLAFVPGRPRSTVTYGSRLIATVTSGQVPADPPARVGLQSAKRAASGFSGRSGHPFPTCFACGDLRPTGDGLELAPGPVAGRPGTVASPWLPKAEEGVDGAPVRDELVWSALDCPGGWTDDPLSRPRLLSRMTARVLRPPRSGELCVVVARRGTERGRQLRVYSALYDAAGELLASAAAAWTALAVPGGHAANHQEKDTA